MAAGTLGVSTASTANTTSYASGSFTPAANDLLVVFVTASDTVAAGSLSNSAGLTFTKIKTATWQSAAGTIYAFVANSLAANSSQTVTFDCTGDAATGCVITVLRYSGFHASRTGNNAVVQSVAVSDHASGTPACTFASTTNTNNPTVAMTAIAVNSNTNFTPPTSWTEAAETNYATPSTDAETIYRDSGFAGTTITWGNNPAQAYGIVALELVPASLTGTSALQAGSTATLSLAGSSALVFGSTATLSLAGSTGATFGNAGASASATTFDPANTGAHLTLSGGNLVATHDSSSGWNTTRGTSSKATDKSYFEIAITGSGSSQGQFVGVETNAAALTNYVGSDTGGSVSWGYYSLDGHLYTNGSQQATAAATYDVGDVIGVAYDPVAQTAQFYKNNVLQFTATSVSANCFPAASLTTASGSSTLTARYRMADFSYSPPPGYAAWGASSPLTATGALAGTAAIAFGSSATLSLVGSAAIAMGSQATVSLVGTSAWQVGSTATTSGAGALSGTAALALSSTSSLAGSGALAGTSALQAGSLATLSLVGASALALASTATMSLAGSSALVFGSTATLSLVGTTAIQVSSTATISLVGASALVVGSTATGAGAGAMTGAAALAFDSTATLSLVGTAGLGVGDDATTLTGAGELAGTAALSFSSSATLAGATTLTGTAALSLAVSAVPSLNGTTPLVCGSITTIVGAGALAGTAGFGLDSIATVSLSGIAALQLGSNAVLVGTGIITGAATLAIGSTATLSSSVALAATGAILFGSTAGLTGTGVLAGTSALVCGSSATLGLVGSATLTFDTHLAYLQLSGRSAWNLIDSGEFEASGFDYGGFDVGSESTLTGVGALAGTDGLTFDSSAIINGSGASGAMIGQSGLTIGAQGALSAFGRLLGSGQIVFVPGATPRRLEYGPVAIRPGSMPDTGTRSASAGAAIRSGSIPDAAERAVESGLALRPGSETATAIRSGTLPDTGTRRFR